MSGTDPTPRVCSSDRLALGEGPRWAGGRLHLVDILTGRLLTARDGGDDPTARFDVVATLPEPLGAVAPVAGRPGHWIAAAGTGICLLGPGGDTTWLARPEDGAPSPARMNDASADPHGRFWAGSMAYDEAEGAGSLYRVDPDGTVSRVLTGITIPNGPAFGADGTTMYLTDTARRVVRRHTVDPESGEIGPGTVFTELASGGPDGMAVDAEGGLWTAVWGKGVVHHFTREGVRDRTVELPASQPAGVCLGGDDLRTLYVTSARTGLGRPGALDGAVFATRADVPGVPVPAFRPAPGLLGTGTGA
ncbi:SMP-30/gluconolactonase/LRE family protein [Streptomyces montanisoli]|uniref:SMP-30/gluconolactonase/LRE family protein n=1 Tax=Streptomyces montanisoli TaxID=2798581 RepID=A0A940MDM5_9ACTN|nr:SMP-30/gluconolactonase/LRE family protein [Streptomyces montanisoli]MBP0456753.1 SMP-30/gluconolactonase/LRE family protein [Streptomyces montanisoli]